GGLGDPLRFPHLNRDALEEGGAPALVLQRGRLPDGRACGERRQAIEIAAEPAALGAGGEVPGQRALVARVEAAVAVRLDHGRHRATRHAHRRLVQMPHGLNTLFDFADRLANLHLEVPAMGDFRAGRGAARHDPRGTARPTAGERLALANQPGDVHGRGCRPARGYRLSLESTLSRMPTARWASWALKRTTRSSALTTPVTLPSSVTMGRRRTPRSAMMWTAVSMPASRETVVAS